jgi:unsaturated chondroitin disaccharide hydrolase
MGEGELGRTTALDPDNIWARAVDKVRRLADRVGARFPHATEGGVYRCEEPHWWTAGFWPGMLWLIWRDSGEARWRDLARACEEALDEPLSQFERLDHDAGFMWTLTSVTQFKLLGTPASRRRALTAASHLAGRFNVQGRYIRAWNPWREGEDNAGLAIIDCLMNLPLLYWASETTGDPRFRHVALAHTETTLAHFLRADGSVRHIVRFDPESGAFADVLGGQGYNPDSAWARGTAWAMYGLALGYRYTGRGELLQAAKRVAHFFVASLPEDGVPEWDFRLPPDDGSIRFKDSSAGACAASALLELAELVPAAEAPAYRRWGRELLASLNAHCGAWDRREEEGLLLHGTGHWPERRNVDVSLIYGDYFFLEALAKLRGQTGLF